MRGQRATIFVAAIAAVAGACSSGSSSSNAHATTRAPAIKTHAAFTAHGRIHGAYVIDVGRDTDLVLANAQGDSVAHAKADALGSAVFYDVQPGPGYTVRTTGGAATDAFN